MVTEQLIRPRSTLFSPMHVQFWATFYQCGITFGFSPTTRTIYI